MNDNTKKAQELLAEAYGCYESELTPHEIRAALVIITHQEYMASLAAMSGKEHGGQVPFGWWATDENGVGRFIRGANSPAVRSYVESDRCRATPLYEITPQPASTVPEISAEFIDEALFYSLDENECGKGPETPMLLDAMGCGCEEQLPYARRLLRGCLTAAMLAASKGGKS